MTDRIVVEDVPSDVYRRCMGLAGPLIALMPLRHSQP